MKNDYSFKLLGLALATGVFLAYINPLDTASTIDAGTAIVAPATAPVR